MNCYSRAGYSQSSENTFVKSLSEYSCSRILFVYCSDQSVRISCNRFIFFNKINNCSYVLFCVHRKSHRETIRLTELIGFGLHSNPRPCRDWKKVIRIGCCRPQRYIMIDVVQHSIRERVGSIISGIICSLSARNQGNK